MADQHRGSAQCRNPCSLSARNRAARCQNGKFYRKSFNYPSRLGTIEMHTLPKELNPYYDIYFFSYQQIECKYILLICSSFCSLYFWETLFSMRASTIVLLVEPGQWYIGLVNKHNRANIVMIFLFLLFSLFSFYYCIIVIGGGSGILV